MRLAGPAIAVNVFPPRTGSAPHSLEKSMSPETLLPMLLLGAPLVLALIDRMMLKS